MLNELNNSCVYYNVPTLSENIYSPVALVGIAVIKKADSQAMFEMILWRDRTVELASFTVAYRFSDAPIAMKDESHHFRKIMYNKEDINSKDYLILRCALPAEGIENGVSAVVSSLTLADGKITMFRQKDFVLTLFLGTGIRISELVGLDNDSFDFEENSFLVTRKGGNQAILYFSDEVKYALQEYITEKSNDQKIPDDERAFFLSMQYKRINVRTVEILVKKYSKIVSPLKKITPHKLRSTYGTRLYNETGDIYIVADVLGHRDVNTTKKHYAAITQENRRKVASAVKLRKDENDQ